ncbi:MAG TPA: DUF6232 family protein [Chitinophagales bacterium]|nr:DUF6232 family protein [Chitinophagales bacterium]
METESVIYTDGHEVKVTSSKLIVKKREYFLSGVTAFRLQIIKANRAAPLILVVLGLAGLIAGLVHALPPDAINPINFNGKFLTANDVVAAVGGLLVFLGIIWMMVVHDRYAVQITTAEGNKDVLVSPKKDYADQIVTALGVALTPVP